MHERKFAMLFPGRTGSSYVVSALAKHPDIVCYGERLDASQDGKSQRAWITQVYEEAPIAGFKTKLVDVADQDDFAGLLESRPAFTICLHRRNLVKSAISNINAFRLHGQHGVWNQTSRDQDMPRVTLLIDELQAAIDEREQLHHELLTYFERLRVPKLMLYYEDLVAEPGVYLGRLLSFLGVLFIPLSGDYLKITHDDLRNSVSNFDEVKVCLRNTRYESMLDELTG